MAVHRPHPFSLLLSLLAGFATGVIAYGWWIEPWTWSWIEALDVDPNRQGAWLGPLVATIAVAVGSAVSPGRTLVRVLAAIAAAAAYTAAVAVAPDLIARDPALGGTAVLAGTAIGFGALGAALRPGIAAYPVALGTVLALDRVAPAVPIQWTVVAASVLAAALAARRDERPRDAFVVSAIASALVSAGVVAAATATGRIEAILAFAIAAAVTPVSGARHQGVLASVGGIFAIAALAGWCGAISPDRAPLWAGGVTGALAGLAIARPTHRGTAVGVGIGAGLGLGAIGLLAQTPTAGWGTMIGAIGAMGLGTAFGAMTLSHGALRRCLAAVPALVATAGGIVWIWPAAMDDARPSPIHGRNATVAAARSRVGTDTLRAIVDLSIAAHPAPRSVLIIGASDGVAARSAVLAAVDAVEVIFDDRTAASRAQEALAPTANRQGTRLAIVRGPTAAALIARRGRFDVVIDFRARDPHGRGRAAVASGGRFFRWMPLTAPAPAAWAAGTLALLEQAPRSIRAWRATVRGDRALGLSVTRDDEPIEFSALRPTRTVADVVDLLVCWRGDASFVARLVATSDADTVAARVAEAGAALPPKWPAGSPPTAAAFADRIRALDPRDLEGAATLAETALESAATWNFGRRFIDATANRLLEDGQETRAAALFDRGVALRPNWGAGLLGQARLRIARLSAGDPPERWEEANALLERSLTHDPESALGWRLQGICLLRARSDAAAARGCFENAASLDPDDPIAKSHLWRYAERDGRLDEALALLIAAHRALPRDARIRDTLYKIAPRMLVARRADLAGRALDTVAPHYQNDPGFFLVRSQVAEATGDLDAAIEAARRSASMTDPPVRGYFLHLYRLLARQSRARERDEVRAFMKRTFDVDPAALPE